MVCFRFFLVYLLICASDVGVRVGARAGAAICKSLQEKDIREPLFLVESPGGLLASLLFNKSARRFYQKQEPEVILTPWLALEM